MKRILIIILFLVVTHLFSQEFNIVKTNEFAISQSYYPSDIVIEDDGYLYTLSSYGLEIYEIENNGELAILSILPITADISISIKDNYAYISAGHTEYDSFCGKLYQINITDKENPYIEQQLDYDHNPFPVQIYGEYLHTMEYDSYNLYYINYFYLLPELSLVTQYEDYLNHLEKLDETTALRYDGYNNFTIFDISDPTQPEIIGSGNVSSQHPYNIHRARTYNDTILICSDNDLISFWDVSDWNNWGYISQYQLPHTLFNYYRPVIKETKMILVEFGYVELIDISDVLQLIQLDIISGTAGSCLSASCVNTNDNIYIATNWNGIQRLKLNNNNLIFEEEIAEYYENARCTKYNNYLIKSTMLHGYEYFDISDPADPIDMGHLLPEYSYYFKMSNNLIAVLDSYTYDCDVYDISNIHTPMLRNSIELDMGNLQEFDTEDETSIYFIDLFDNELVKYDISEPGINELLFVEQLPFDIYCGIIHNGYGYLIENDNNYHQNLYIYKNLHINEPTLYNTINNFSAKSAVDLQIINEYLCIYSQVEIVIEPENNTLFFNLNDPESPELAFEVSSFGRPYINNNLLFTSSGYSCYVFNKGENPSGILEPIYTFYDINGINNISFIEQNNENFLLLCQWSNIGVFEYEYNTALDENELIKPEYSLSNYPNPFNPGTKIVFNFPEEGNVKLEIFNIKGEKVKTLMDCYTSPGDYELIWNGKDDNQKRVASGVYFYKLQTPSNNFTKKCMLLK